MDFPKCHNNDSTPKNYHYIFVDCVKDVRMQMGMESIDPIHFMKRSKSKETRWSCPRRQKWWRWKGGRGQSGESWGWWNFHRASKGYSLLSETISRFIRNLYVLLDSRKGHWGHVESWQGSWCPILMKLSQKLQKDTSSYPIPFPGSSGTSMSS